MSFLHFKTRPVNPDFTDIIAEANAVASSMPGLVGKTTVPIADVVEHDLVTSHCSIRHCRQRSEYRWRLARRSVPVPFPTAADLADARNPGRQWSGEERSIVRDSSRTLGSDRAGAVGRRLVLDYRRYFTVEWEDDPKDHLTEFDRACTAEQIPFHAFPGDDENGGLMAWISSRHAERAIDLWKHLGASTEHLLAPRSYPTDTNR